LLRTGSFRHVAAYAEPCLCAATPSVHFRGVAMSDSEAFAIHAVARSTMSELIRIRETGAALRVVGTYSDQFVKSEGVWCFAKRTITPRYERDTEAPTRIFGEARPPTSKIESVHVFEEHARRASNSSIRS
jgi:hypothetical protein